MVSSLPAQSWTNALQGWWCGDSTTVDLAGTNEARLRGSASYVAGAFQDGFHLNGTNDYLEVPDAPSQRPARVTVAAWVSFERMDTPRASAPGLQYIVFKRRPSGDGFEGYTLVKDRLPGSERLKFVIASGSGEPNQVVVTSTTVVQTNTFYFVVGTQDGTTAKLYVNGVLESSRPAPFLLNYAATPLFVGSSRQSYDGRLAGVVDEVMLWGRALDAVEIRTLWDLRESETTLTISVAPPHVLLGWPATGQPMVLESREHLGAGNWSPTATTGVRRSQFEVQTTVEPAWPGALFRRTPFP